MTIEEELELVFEVRFEGSAGQRTLRGSTTLRCTGTQCKEVDLSGHIRRGWQLPYGQPQSVLFRVLEGSSRFFSSNPGWVHVRVVALHSTFARTCAWLGGIALVCILLVFVKFLASVCMSADPTTPDQVIVAVIALLASCSMLTVWSVVLQSRITSPTFAHRYRITLCIAPYLFRHAMQGGMLSLLYHLPPGGGSPYPLAFGWFVFMTLLTVSYVVNATPYNEDVLDGYWALYSGDEFVSTGTVENVLAAAYGGSTVLWCFFALWGCCRSWHAFRHLPYLAYRHRFLKLRVVAGVAAAIVVNHVATIPSNLSLVSPIKGNHMGSVLADFVVVLSLVGGFLPVFYTHGADSAPPSPLSDAWKNRRWPVPWRRWLQAFPAAKTLYYFETREEEQKFWELQHLVNGSCCRGEDEDSTDEGDTSCVSLLCSKRDSAPSLDKLKGLVIGYLASLVFWYGLVVMWVCGILFGLCYPKALKFACKATRRVGNIYIEGVFSLSPEVTPVGLLPIEVEPDTVWANLTFRTVLVMVYITWIDIFFSAPFGWTVLVLVPLGLLLNNFVLTEPLGALLLSIAENICAVIVWLQRHWVTWWFLEGVQREEGVQEVPVAPPDLFCLEAASLAAQLCYESYKGREEEQGPLQDENSLPPSLPQLIQHVDLAAPPVVAVMGDVRVMYAREARTLTLFVVFRKKKHSLLHDDLPKEFDLWEEMDDDFLARQEERQNKLVTKLFGARNSLNEGPKVVRGYAAVWAAIRDAVCGEVAGQAEPVRRVVLCGHHHGAGVALLAAYPISKAVPQAAVSVWAFAPPHVGNATFAAMLREVAHATCVGFESNDELRLHRPLGPATDVRVAGAGQVFLNCGGGERWMAGCRRLGDTPTPILRFQSSVAVAVALHAPWIAVPVGEDAAVTDGDAWPNEALPWGLGPYRVGEFVTASVGGEDTSVARVMTYLDADPPMVRVRIPRRSPVDVPVSNLSDPPPFAPRHSAYLQMDCIPLTSSFSEP